MEEQETLIYIDENDALDAGVSAKNFAKQDVRNRAYYNTLGAKLAKKFLASEDVDISNVYNIHSIQKVLENLDISDIMLNNIHIDVRVVFNENFIFIPKSHFNYEILPDVYLVLLMSNDKKYMKFLGFFEPKLINKNNQNEDYYFIEKEKLTAPANLKNFVTNFRGNTALELSQSEVDEADMMILSLVDHDITEENKKHLLQSLVKSAKLRDRFIEFENFELLSYQAINATDILKPDFDQEKFEEPKEEISYDEAAEATAAAFQELDALGMAASIHTAPANAPEAPAAELESNDLLGGEAIEGLTEVIDTDDDFEAELMAGFGDLEESTLDFAPETNVSAEPENTIETVEETVIAEAPKTEDFPEIPEVEDIEDTFAGLAEDEFIVEDGIGEDFENIDNIDTLEEKKEPEYQEPTVDLNDFEEKVVEKTEVEEFQAETQSLDEFETVNKTSTQEEFTPETVDMSAFNIEPLTEPKNLDLEAPTEMLDFDNVEPSPKTELANTSINETVNFDDIKTNEEEIENPESILDEAEMTFEQLENEKAQALDEFYGEPDLTMDTDLQEELTFNENITFNEEDDDDQPIGTTPFGEPEIGKAPSLGDSDEAFATASQTTFEKPKLMSNAEESIFTQEEAPLSIANDETLQDESLLNESSIFTEDDELDKMLAMEDLVLQEDNTPEETIPNQEEQNNTLGSFEVSNDLGLSSLEGFETLGADSIPQTETTKEIPTTLNSDASADDESIADMNLDAEEIKRATETEGLELDDSVHKPDGTDIEAEDLISQIDDLLEGEEGTETAKTSESEEMLENTTPTEEANETSQFSDSAEVTEDDLSLLFSGPSVGGDDAALENFDTTQVAHTGGAAPAGFMNKKNAIVAGALLVLLAVGGGFILMKGKSSDIMPQNPIGSDLPQGDTTAENDNLLANAPDLDSAQVPAPPTGDKKVQNPVPNTPPVPQPKATNGANPEKPQTGAPAQNAKAPAKTEVAKAAPVQTPQNKGIAYTSIKSLTWEVPDYLSYSDRMKNYLQTAGKSIRLTLSSDLLLVQEYAYSNQIKVSIKLKNNGIVESAEIAKSSGSDQINELVLRTVKETLNVVKPAPGEVPTENFKLGLIINLQM